ncbi:hypothetical protein COLO4_30890 [Corchorus olitorius]|uniref:XS domain-containing protein n=1 Tax=Corchorus olitorius TaxID=93759 RepID=A0A1R3H6T2_9ROSI|nr:hypothetical protein COLO4_30890 [Corchorus olitorius]
MYGVMKEDEVLELSSATFAIINSESSSSSTPEAIPSPGSDLSLEEELQEQEELERETGEAQSTSGLSCNEKQRIISDDKGRENFMSRKPRKRGPSRHSHSKLNGRRMEHAPQISSRNEFHAKTSSTTATPATAQIVGIWKGLKDNARDHHQIVWPPMVVIMNTMTNFYKNGKWLGMGSRELLELFSSYPAMKAQHSYGPQGHRGISVLVFESSAVGYLEAERLHKDFVEQGLGRFAWNNSCSESDVTLPGGGRQLYGFMAVKEDLDIFNLHCQGKSKIKYELKSYEEAVLKEIKKMREQEVMLAEERKVVKTLQGSLYNMNRYQQRNMNDIQIFKRRVQSLHKEHKEEMDCQENFYKDQLKIKEAKVKELESWWKWNMMQMVFKQIRNLHLQQPYQYNSNIQSENLKCIENLGGGNGPPALRL